MFKNYAFKADGVVNQAMRGNFTFYENNKIKNGRSAGPTRPAETSWDQTGPTKYFKGEGNFVVGSQLFATAKVAHVDGGFVLAPVGGLGTDYYIDDGGVAHNTFYQYQSDPSAGLRQRRRQLLRRQARAEVRRRLAQHAGDDRSRSGRPAT